MVLMGCSIVVYVFSSELFVSQHAAIIRYNAAEHAADSMSYMTKLDVAEGRSSKTQWMLGSVDLCMGIWTRQTYRALLELQFIPSHTQWCKLQKSIYPATRLMDL